MNYDNLLIEIKEYESNLYDDIRKKSIFKPKTKEELQKVVNQYMKKDYQGKRDINMWDVSNIKDMNNLFADNITSLQNVNSDRYILPLNDIAYWDVSNVTNMQGMFTACRCIGGNLNNWDVSNVTDMSYMFSYTCGITFSRRFMDWELDGIDIDIDKWDVSKVIDMGDMFSYSKILNLDIGQWDVFNVLYMDHMFAEFEFYDDLSSWDVINVIYVNGMYYNCTMIKKFQPKFHLHNLISPLSSINNP